MTLVFIKECTRRNDKLLLLREKIEKRACDDILRLVQVSNKTVVKFVSPIFDGTQVFIRMGGCEDIV